MKKMNLMMIGLITLMASGMAAATPLTGGNNDLMMGDCDLLANDVRIVLTNNVIGGLQCNEADSFIAMSVCHATGSKVSRSAVVLLDDEGEVACVVTDDQNCVQVVTGSAFPTASTALGTVASLYPSQECTTANVEALADAQVLPAGIDFQ